MNPFVLLAAIVAVTGAVVAVGVRDAPVAGLGLAVVLIGSAFVLAPPPTLTAMAFRVVAGVLASYLVLVAARRVPVGVGTPLGVRATAAAAVATFAAGLGVTPLVLQRSGPEAAVAAGLALLALAAGPVALGRDPFRIGGGLLVAACGTLVLRAALGGAPSAFEEIAEGILVVALAATVAVLIAIWPVAEWVGTPVGRDTDGTDRRATPGVIGRARRAASPTIGARSPR